MNAEILVLCPFGLDEGLVSKAAELSGNRSVRVLIPAGQQEQAMAVGAAVIHMLETDSAVADEALFARWLAEKIRIWGSRIVLAPATVVMRNLMPMLAWQLKAGLTADCTQLQLEADALLQTRPAFGNSLMATIRSMSDIQMATVRPGTFRPAGRACLEAVLITEAYRPEEERVKQTACIPFEQGMPLGQARIVVAGGLGVGSAAGFQKLEHAAQLLGAAIGASRAAVDAGFAPYRCQIGMTGATVCPKLYIAVGISGAVQHLAGMSGAEKVIAVNSDPKAPIFDYADYGIVGDWEEVIAELIRILKEEPL